MSDNKDRYRVNIVSDEAAHEALRETFKNAAKLEHDRSDSALKQSWYAQTPQQMVEGEYNGSMFSTNLNVNKDHIPKK